jgi:hypothetical protein
MNINPSIEAMDAAANITRVSRIVITAESVVKQKMLAQMFDRLFRFEGVHFTTNGMRIKSRPKKARRSKAR